MPITLSEKFLAYLALFSGLALSIVAEYYSILGLTSIFAAAVIPVIIMGIALGLGKITATLWLKQNWEIAPWTMRAYLFTAIIVLMLITSMGIFGFLSKAHSDQNLVSGDIQSRIAVYDEKIKTAKENIDANRKALKQMDEAVDQVMGRSQDEKGADKAVALRRGQAKERTRLLSEITAEQKTITQLSEERAPIAAEVRKVEAEVGPIKYIAAFIYGDTDQTILEKAVTWVIIILIIVFDPLAVILLLASQISFQNFRERKTEQFSEWTDNDFEEFSRDAWVADVGEKPTKEELADEELSLEELKNKYGEGDLDIPAEPAPHHPDTHPYLRQGFKYPEGWVHEKPLVATSDEDKEWARWVEHAEVPIPDAERPGDHLNEPLFVQNEEQKESDLWSTTQITREEYLQTAAAADDPHNDAPHPEVADYLRLIRSGKMRLQDVPATHIEGVKKRL